MGEAMLDDLIPLVDVPEGKYGPWKVERFTVSKAEADLYNLRLAVMALHSSRVKQGGARINYGR